MSLQCPVANLERSASTESLPVVKPISLRSVIETMSMVPPLRQPSPEGWLGTSTMVSALPSTSTAMTRLV